MSSRISDEHTEYRRFREAYEEAFHLLASRVRLLQSLTLQAGADGAAVEEARRGVEEALAAYRASRDALARFILAGSSIQDKAGQRHEDQRSRIERLAYELWESSGRPSGKAKENWRRAEEMVHAG